MELLLVCDPGKAQQSSWSFALTCPLTCDSEWLDEMKSCKNFGQGLRWVVPTVPLCSTLHQPPKYIKILWFRNPVSPCITWELGHPWFRDSRALQLFGSTASNVFQPQRQVPHTIPFTISPCDCAQKTHTAARTLGKCVNTVSSEEIYPSESWIWGDATVKSMEGTGNNLIPTWSHTLKLRSGSQH